MDATAQWTRLWVLRLYIPSAWYLIMVNDSQEMLAPSSFSALLSLYPTSPGSLRWRELTPPPNSLLSFGNGFPSLSHVSFHQPLWFHEHPWYPLNCLNLWFPSGQTQMDYFFTFPSSYHFCSMCYYWLFLCSWNVLLPLFCWLTSPVSAYTSPGSHYSLLIFSASPFLSLHSL